MTSTLYFFPPFSNWHRLSFFDFTLFHILWIGVIIVQTQIKYSWLQRWKDVLIDSSDIIPITHSYSFYPLYLTFLENICFFFLRITNPYQPSKRAENKNAYQKSWVRWRRYNFIFLFQCTWMQTIANANKNLKCANTIATQIVWNILMLHILPKLSRKSKLLQPRWKLFRNRFRWFLV